MKFFLLINIKMPTIVCILTFMNWKNSILGLSEPKKSWISWYFYTYEHLKFHAQLSWAWKKFYNLGPWSVLQIRRGNRDNLGIISHISPYRYILWAIIRTILPRWLDSSNEGSQHMFSLRNKKNYLWIILNTASYLELWSDSRFWPSRFSLNQGNRAASFYSSGLLSLLWVYTICLGKPDACFTKRLNPKIFVMSIHLWNLMKILGLKSP